MNLIIAFEKAETLESVIVVPNIKAMRICDDIELEIIKEDYDKKDWQYDITQSERDIDVLENASYIITGWDITSKSFVIRGSEASIYQAKLNKIDTEYRTPRTLADASLGDEFAIAKLTKANELSEPLRIKLKELESVITPVQAKTEAKDE